MPDTDGHLVRTYTPPAHQAHPHDVGVVITNLNPGHVDASFFESWDGLRNYDNLHCGHTLAGSVTLQTGPRVAEGRTQIIQGILKDHRFDQAQWILTIDSDMTFDEDVLCRMLEVAYTNQDQGEGHLKILGALCFAGGRTRAFPTIYESIPGEFGPEPKPVDSYPENALVRVFATGAAAMLIHRSVFERMLQPYPHGFGTIKDGRRAPFPWYIEGVNHLNLQAYGEDVAFCMRAQALTPPVGVWVHTGIEFGHRKTYELNEFEFKRLQLEKKGRQVVLPDLRAATPSPFDHHKVSP